MDPEILHDFMITTLQRKGKDTIWFRPAQRWALKLKVKIESKKEEYKGEWEIQPGRI